MTRLSDGMVVQARLHLNQGMGAFFASVGDQFSCLNFFHFRYVLLVFVLVFVEVLTGPHFLQKPGQPVEQIRANPSTCWRTPGAPLWVPRGVPGVPPFPFESVDFINGNLMIF